MREGGKKILATSAQRPGASCAPLGGTWKGMFVPSTLFEEMGFHYTGPIDGHDVDALAKTLGMPRPSRVLKATAARHHHQGQGLRTRRRRPDRLPRGIAASSIRKRAWWRNRREETGDLYRRVRRLAVRYGRRRSEAARHHPGDARRLGPGALLEQRNTRALFRRRHRRTARGDAGRGHGLRRRQKPVVAIYSTFLQRATTSWCTTRRDPEPRRAVRHRPRRRGRTGWRHPCRQPDLSYLRCVPNMPVMAPADENETPADAQSTGLQHATARPRCAIRAAAARRGGGNRLDTLPIGKARIAPARFAYRPARLRRHRPGRGTGRRRNWA